MVTTSKLGIGNLNYFFKKQRERTAVSSKLSNNQDNNGLNESSKDQGDGNIIAVSTRNSVLGLGLVNEKKGRYPVAVYEEYWYSQDAFADSYEYIEISIFSLYTKIHLFAAKTKEMRQISSLTGPSRVNDELYLPALYYSKA